MPLACVLTHEPDAATAVLLDGGLALASCTRCGSGLFDNGGGWTSPLSPIAVLRRPASPRAGAARAARRRRRSAGLARAGCVALLLLCGDAIAGHPALRAAGGMVPGMMGA